MHNENQPFDRFGMLSSRMVKACVATRLERQDFDRIRRRSGATNLSKAEVARRLILIGLRNVKQVEDLLTLWDVHPDSSGETE